MTDRAAPSTVQLGPCLLHRLTERECVAFVAGELAAGRGGWIVTANVDYVRRTSQDQEFASLCAAARLTTADGMPLVWASRLCGRPVPERVTGSSLIWTMSAMAAREGRSVYLLGGAPGTAGRSAIALRRANPGLRVAGVASPEFETRLAYPAVRETSDMLAAARPDIVYVALGSPKTEYLIAALRRLHPTVWWIGVGISFSFVGGELTRAPAWMQRVGLEWLHRVVHEPSRLARRYFIEDAPFAVQLLVGSIWMRLRHRNGEDPWNRAA